MVVWSWLEIDLTSAAGFVVASLLLLLCCVKLRFSLLLLLELMVLGLPSTLITLVLWRVDFSVSSDDLSGGENIDGDIFSDGFQLKYFNIIILI